MRRMVLLFGLLTVCLSASMTQAQDNGWPDFPPCYPTTLYYDNSGLPSPTMHPQDEGGTSSFVFSWDPVTGGDFSHYFIFLFLEEPTLDEAIDSDEFCPFKTYPIPTTSPQEMDFSHDISDLFGDQVEGRVWASIHTRKPRSGGGYIYSRPVVGVSLVSAFWDNTAPAFSETGFTETNLAEAIRVRGTSKAAVHCQGIIDDGLGFACQDELLPAVRYQLFVEGLDGFSFTGFDGLENGIPYVNLNSCDFSIPLTIEPSDQMDRKNLTIYLRDSAMNMSEPLELPLEYLEPLTAQVYPNPVNLGDGTPVTIQILGSVKANTPVRIFDTFGHLVKDLSFDGFDTSGDMASITWNGANGQGQLVGTGAYLYVIEAENGETITGKIAVVQ